MADRLYLSYWIRGYTESNMLRHFEKLLRAFPFSTNAPAPLDVRVYAIRFAEPPYAERMFDEAGSQLDKVMATCREFSGADCACSVEGYWDIWRFDDGWKLARAPVTLLCFGPLFDNDSGDNLRIELGIEADFLPQPTIPESARKVESNIRGLLRLAHELDDALPIANRSLWSESGENFADRLTETLASISQGDR
ncbi:MAG: hypothetical protein ABFD60_13080 [Bryobacteraceae bacterium]